MSKFNIEIEAKNKRKASVGTFIFLMLLLLVLIWPFLSFQVPPPGQEGILISFGQPETGQGILQPIVERPDNSEPEEEKQPEEPEKAQPEKEIEKPEKPMPKPLDNKPVITNDRSQEIALQKEKDKKAIEARAKAEEAQKVAEAQAEAKRKAEAEKKRLEDAKKQFGFPGSNNNSTGQGNTGKPGDQGAPDGDPNAENLEGNKSTGLGSSDVGGGLAGRGVASRPTVNDKSQKTGTVRIKICVNPSGKVTSTEYTMIGSNTQDSYLIDLALENARKFKFDPEPMAPESQCGHITFNFKLQ